MKEFMLLIRNHADSKESFTPALHHEFVSKCEVYIGNLTREGKTLGWQPPSTGSAMAGSGCIPGRLADAPGVGSTGFGVHDLHRLSHRRGAGCTLEGSRHGRRDLENTGRAHEGTA